MANDLQTANEPSVTSLVGGIINDSQQLIGQQLNLFRREIQQDMARTRQAACVLGAGVGVGLLASIVLIFALAHLIHWAAPDLPLWACYGLVGVVVGGIAGWLVYAGKKQFDAFNPLPDQSFQALQENVQWLTKAPK